MRATSSQMQERVHVLTIHNYGLLTVILSKWIVSRIELYTIVLLNGAKQ